MSGRVGRAGLPSGLCQGGGKGDFPRAERGSHNLIVSFTLVEAEVS
jgi:hypothetical protein